MIYVNNKHLATPTQVESSLPPDTGQESRGSEGPPTIDFFLHNAPPGNTGVQRARAFRTVFFPAFAGVTAREARIVYQTQMPPQHPAPQESRAQSTVCENNTN